MNNYINRIFLLFTILLTSCSGMFLEEDEPNTPVNNFKLLWELVDNKYCFFLEKNINWNEIYHKYNDQVNNEMSDEDLFMVLSNMLSELKDGHVNLVSDFNTSKYWDWYLDYPQNFNEEVLERAYLKEDYNNAGSLVYRIFDDNIGYIRYSSFMSMFITQNIDYVIDNLKNSKGIIIDIRNNTGGYVNLTDSIASRFTDKERIVSYYRYKAGPEHNDFSPYYAKTLKSAGKTQITNIPIVVLTNRMVYSAANDFTCKMKTLPHVTIMGDKTGGGGGGPISSELYNGWQVRFSAMPLYDNNKKEIESGIDPDIKINLDIELLKDSVDSMIETARAFINNQ